MENNLFRAIINNKYKGDERQVEIRNKVYAGGFIGLCLGLMIYFYVKSILSEFRLPNLSFSLFEQITFLIGLCCTVMTFILCKKGAFYGYSNGLLIIGSTILVPFGIADITHLTIFEFYNIPAYCSELQFQILNISVNAALPVALIFILLFLMNRLYVHSR